MAACRRLPWPDGSKFSSSQTYRFSLSKHSHADFQREAAWLCSGSETRYVCDEENFVPSGQGSRRHAGSKFSSSQTYRFSLSKHSHADFQRAIEERERLLLAGRSVVQPIEQ